MTICNFGLMPLKIKELGIGWLCCKSNGGTFIIYAFPRHYRRDWPGSVSIPESNYFLRSYEFGPFRIGGCFSCGDDFFLYFNTRNLYSGADPNSFPKTSIFWREMAGSQKACPVAQVQIFKWAAQKDFELLDSMLDDGDLTQGKFRQTPNGRYTYIIEE